MPLLSQICDFCGHVVEENGDGTGNLSIAAFVDKLEGSLRDLKAIPQPSFGKSMSQLSFIMLPILAVFMLFVAIISEAGLFWILFVLFLVLGIVAIIRKSKGKLGNDPFNRRFREIKNEYEYNERMAKRSFGQSREVSGLLDEISGQIQEIEKKRKSASARNLIVWLVILLAFVALGAWGVRSLNRVLNEPESVETGASAWRQEVDRFKTTSANDDYADRGLRLELVNKMIAEGELTEAENFFTAYCMGKMGDMDCASAIVRYYKGLSDTAAGEAFIERCTGLRYNSDKAKLTKLLTQ